MTRQLDILDILRNATPAYWGKVNIDRIVDQELGHIVTLAEIRRACLAARVGGS